MSQKDVVLSRVDEYLSEVNVFLESSKKFIGEFEKFQKEQAVLDVDNLVALLSTKLEDLTYSKDLKGATKRFYRRAQQFEKQTSDFINECVNTKGITEAFKESVQDIKEPTL